MVFDLCPKVSNWILWLINLSYGVDNYVLCEFHAEDRVISSSNADDYAGERTQRLCTGWGVYFGGIRLIDLHKSGRLDEYSIWRELILRSLNRAEYDRLYIGIVRCLLISS